MTEKLNEKLNKVLLARIRDIIVKEPSSFDMGYFRGKGAHGNHICNTTHCIAGWAKALTNDVWDNWKNSNIVEEARNALGLTNEEAFAMFYGSWPKGYGSCTDGCEYLSDIKAEDAVRMINDLIDNKLDIRAFGIEGATEQDADNYRDYYIETFMCGRNLDVD